MKKQHNKAQTLLVAGKYILFLSITAVLLYFSFKGVSWNDLMDSMRTANWWWITVSMATGYLAFIIRARRWQLIIHPLGYNPSFKNTYDGVMLTYLANFAMPRMGEIVRCGALRKTEKIPIESLFGTVVMERGIDFVCLLVICFSVAFFQLNTFGAFLNTKIWQPLLDNFSSGNFIAFTVVATLITSIVVLCKKHISKLPYTGKIKKIWNGLLGGLRTVFYMRKRGEFFALTTSLWIMYWLQAYTVMLAMPETQQLGIIVALYLMIVGGLGWVAPVQGGMGAYHFLIALTLSSMSSMSSVYPDIPFEHGVIFATISHETQAIIMIIFGMVSWVSVALINKKVNKNHKL